MKALIILSIILVSTVSADTYTWTTKDGVVHMSNYREHKKYSTTTIKSGHTEQKQKHYKEVKSTSAVPQEIHKKIMAYVEKIFPNNYEYQQVMYKKQVQAYFRMRQLKGE